MPYYSMQLLKIFALSLRIATYISIISAFCRYNETYIKFQYGCLLWGVRVMEPGEYANNFVYCYGRGCLENFTATHVEDSG